MRRLLRATLAVPALAYLGAIGYLSANERALVFHPADRTVRLPPSELALAVEPVTFRAADSTRIAAWVIPAAAGDSAPWMLICHGNYGNIGYGGRPRFYADMRDLGINLLAFDYRGFGASEGASDERGVYEDARAAYDWLRRERHVPESRIVIFGHSLGSGVATELATHVHAAALIVEGAFTSVPDRGQELYPYLPVRLIARNRFASIEKVGTIPMPKLFLHAVDDSVIPFAHGRALFAAASEPKQFVALHGGHEDAYRLDHDRYFGGIRAFLAPLVLSPLQDPALH
jgi:fermentation-respiration switch protein FrsA (DUF1100 family)